MSDPAGSRQLLCEGDDRSVDAPLLRELLRGLPVTVVPAASRGALERRADTDATKAIRDGDFPTDLAHWLPVPRPRLWHVDGVWRGWIWRRKEIENYLLDPEVLVPTFGWSPERRDAYLSLLDELLHATAERTAARMALVGLLPGFERPVVKPFDPVLSGDALEDALRQRHRRARAATRFDEEELIARFRAFLPLFRPGGPGFHPWVIAGKDLLGAIARIRGIRERFPELVVPARLADAVLAAMRADPEPWRRLPEWSALRGHVDVWTSAPPG
jgi:hypothetical protein